MLRRSLGRIAQLAKASLAQQSASLENISSSQLIVSNQGPLSLAPSSNSWSNLHSLRFYSSETSSGGSDAKSKTSVEPAQGGNSVAAVPAAAVSTPVESDAALDAWGAAMDKGWYLMFK